MRTLAKIIIPVEKGNAAIKDGSLPQIIQSTIDKLQPEAAYFFADNDGQRSAFIVFDLKSPADIPVIAEPLFIGANASVEFIPVMNADDLKAGLGRLNGVAAGVR